RTTTRRRYLERSSTSWRDRRSSDSSPFCAFCDLALPEHPLRVGEHGQEVAAVALQVLARRARRDLLHVGQRGGAFALRIAEEHPELRHRRGEAEIVAGRA